MPAQKINTLIITFIIIMGLGLLIQPVTVLAGAQLNPGPQLVAPNLMVIFANGYSMNREMNDIDYPAVLDAEKYRFDDTGYINDPNLGERGTYNPNAVYGNKPSSKLYISKQVFTDILTDDAISADINIGFATFRTLMGGTAVTEQRLAHYTWPTIYPKDGLVNSIYTDTNPNKLLFGQDPQNFSYVAWHRQWLNWGNAGGICPKNDSGVPRYGKETGNIDNHSGLNIMDDNFATYLNEYNGFGGLPNRLRYNSSAIDRVYTGTNCNGGNTGWQYGVDNSTGARSTAEATANEPVIKHYLCETFYKSQQNTFEATYISDKPFVQAYPSQWQGNKLRYLYPGFYLFNPSSNRYEDNQGNDTSTLSIAVNWCNMGYQGPNLVSDIKAVITDKFLNVGPLAAEAAPVTAYMSYIPDFTAGTDSDKSNSNTGVLSGWSGESTYIYNCTHPDNDNDETDCISSQFPAGAADPSLVGRNLSGIPADNDAGIVANSDYKYVTTGIQHMGVFLDIPNPASGYIDQRSTINSFMGLEQMSHSGLDYNPITQTINNSKGIAVSVDENRPAQSPIYMSLLNAYGYYQTYKQIDSFDHCRSNNVLLFYDGKEDARWTVDGNGNKVFARPEEIAQKLYDDYEIKVHVIIISNNPGDIAQANLIAQNGGTLQAYTVQNSTELKDAFTSVFAELGLTGEVSEVAAGIPPQIKAGKQAFIASRLSNPSQGHLRAYSFTDSGSLQANANWDAATEMTVAERTAELYSSDNDTHGAKILFNNLDAAAFSAAASPTVADIKAYTLNPAYGGGTYLAGREASSRLGSISGGNSIDLLTSDINRSLYLRDPDYRPYFSGTITSRSEKVFTSSDDGFLYAFNQSDGDLAWGWIPRSLVKYLKAFNSFQSNHFMQGDLDILDIKHGGNYATYAVGGYRNGRGHYVLKIAADGDLNSVIWDEDRGTQLQAPNHGEMAYFKNIFDDTTYVAYVVTDNSSQSTLVIRSIADATDITEVALNFTATSTPFVGPDYKRSHAPSSKTMYLGDNTGDIHQAALMDISGTLKSSADLQTDFDDNDTINFGDTSSPVLFLGTARSAKDRKYYLRAQSKDRLTVFRYDTDNHKWEKQWSSYVTGAGTWDTNGLFTADNSGTPSDNDNDGYATDVPNGIQSLLPASEITDSAVIVADSIVLPVSVGSVGGPLTCGIPKKAFYYLYKLSDGTFPGHTFYHHPDSPEAAPNPQNPMAPVTLEISKNIILGLGEAKRVQMKDLAAKDQFVGFGQADQNKDQGIKPKPAFIINTDLSTGIKGWVEIGRN